MLEASIEGARGILLNISGGSDLGLFEVNEAAEVIHGVAHPDANIIFGAVIDDEMGDDVRVTVIAAGFERFETAGSSTFTTAAGSSSYSSTSEATSYASTYSADDDDNDDIASSFDETPSYASSSSDVDSYTSSDSYGTDDDDDLEIADVFADPSDEPRDILADGRAGGDDDDDDDLDVPSFLR